MSDVKRRVMFSRKEGRAIGSYEYRLGLVHTTFSKEAAALLEDPSLIQRYADDPDKKLQLLLEASAQIHERRHYLDTFGTLAGMSMFASHMSCVKQFIGASGCLTDSKQQWQLPLSTWSRQPDCPPEIRRLRRFAQAESTAVDVFRGSFEPVAAPGHVAEWWVAVPVEVAGLAGPVVTPAFPLSFGTGESETQILDGDARATTVYFPIGCEALLEGSAHSLARAFVEDVFPDLEKDFMVRYGPPLRLKGSSDEADMAELGGFAKPYNITDLMISKMLRAHGTPAFPRSLVLKLTDIALSQGVLMLEHLDDPQVRCEMHSPGRALIETIASAPRDQLREDTVPYPESIRLRYASLLERYKKGGDWDQVEGRHDDRAAVYVWESFLVHHLVIPLLERRLASGHALFHDAVESMRQIFDKALPVVEVVNGQLAFRNIPDEVRTAWFRQMMLSEIAQQVLNDAEVVLCPRAHDLLPGMKSVDFADGNCDRNKRRGCGSWAQGRRHKLPSCLFTRTLKIYGFIPIRPVQAAPPDEAEVPAAG